MRITSWVCPTCWHGSQWDCCSSLHARASQRSRPISTSRSRTRAWTSSTLGPEPSYTVGDLRLDILSPNECWTGTESDTNNDALVVMLSRGDDTVLLATEPEEPAQEWLLDSGTALQADVLKVPHHGAATSIPEFFQAVQAQVAVVSVGENTYGHPVPSTLAALEATGAHVWRTDQHGTITVTFAGGQPVVTGDR